MLSEIAFFQSFKTSKITFLKTFFLLGFIFLKSPLFAQIDTITYKVRLPESINGFSNVTTPVISEDGNTLWFDRKFHPENTGGINDPDDMWRSTFQNGTWQNPVKSYGTPGSMILFPENDIKSLFFYNSALKQTPFVELKAPDNGNGVSTSAINIRNFYNRSQFISAFRSLDKNVILLAIARDDTRGNLDLYVSFKNSEPINLGNSINTSAIETAPLLARDGKTLYFASSGHGGYGKLDLFKSTRLDNSWQSWNEPQNLGNVINTQEDENSMCLTQTGDTAYVVS